MRACNGLILFRKARGGSGSAAEDLDIRYYRIAVARYYYNVWGGMAEGVWV